MSTVDLSGIRAAGRNLRGGFNEDVCAEALNKKALDLAYTAATGNADCHTHRASQSMT
jgi:hypothetical protein